MKKKKQASEAEKTQIISNSSDNLAEDQKSTALENDVELISDEDGKIEEIKPEEDQEEEPNKKQELEKGKKENSFTQKIKNFFTEKKYRPARIGICVELVAIVVAVFVGLALRGVNPFAPTKFRIVSVSASKIKDYITENDSTFLII